MFVRDNYSVMMAVSAAQSDSRKLSECLSPLASRFFSSEKEWDDLRLGSSLRVEFSREEFPSPDSYHNYTDYDFLLFRIGRTYIRITYYALPSSFSPVSPVSSLSSVSVAA